MPEVRVIEGDCLSVLPTLEAGSVDAVITSAPYAMQRKKLYGGITEASYPEWTVAWMAALRPALHPLGSVLINIREHRTRRGGMGDYVHRTRMAIRAAGWVEVDEIIWVKPNAAPFGPNALPRRSWERVLWFSRESIPWCDPLDRTRRCNKAVSVSLGTYKARAGVTGGGPPTTPQHPRRPNIVHAAIGQDGPGVHPAAFPVSLARQLISLVVPPGGTVLDPFAGSGTTGVAALAEGRNAVLVERHPPYVEIIRKRLAEALAAA